MDDQNRLDEHRARVMVVDDNQANLTLLGRILASAGLDDVTLLDDPLEAVARFDELAPDIVLVDLHMPRLDGRQVIQSVRERLAEDDFLPIVVLTADTTIEARNGALDAGAHDFVTKPFDVTEVQLRVRNLLRARAMHVRLQHDKQDLEEQVRDLDAERRRQTDELALRRSRIQRVLDGEGLSVVFQPIVDLDAGVVAGMEALARFDREPGWTPDRWFAEAAELGLGVDLELAAVNEALRHFGRVPDASYLSVNVGPELLVSGRLDEHLGAFPPERLVVELTEHEQVENYGALVEGLAALRAQGLRVAVDDTGSGFASLQHILRLQPDIIKVDLALTQGIDRDPARRALGRALVSFGREIDATIVAEGVETESELATLRSIGIRCAQGYYLGRPAPLTGRPAGGDDDSSDDAGSAASSSFTTSN